MGISYRRPGQLKGRFDPHCADRIRARIQGSQVANQLIAFAEGKIEMTPQRVTACVALLRKVAPDLSATEIQGDVAHFVARLPEPAKSVEDWSASVEKPLLKAQDIAPEPDSATVSREPDEISD